MKILVFELANENSLLSRLRKRYRSIGFQKYNPSEDLENEGPNLTILDSIDSLQHVTLIDDLDAISPSKMNSSEMLMTMRIMVKIGSLKTVNVIAVPTDYPEDSAFEEICDIIDSLPKQNDD